MFMQTVLILIIAVIAYNEDIFGTTFIGRPLVTGLFVGLALGNVQQGLIIGATLELVWMGFMGIGATVPPDVISGGILGTAFAIQTGSDVDVALTLALPIATLGMVVKNLYYVFVIPAMTHRADKLVEDGKYRQAANMHMYASESKALVLALLTTAAFYFGSGVMETIVNAIPVVFTDGMNIATGLLPAVGFAMLISMTWSKKVAPFFFLGYVLYAYLGMDMLGIAMIGGIFGVVMFIVLGEMNKNNRPGMEVVEDEEF